MIHWALHLSGPKSADYTAVTVRHCVYCFGSDHRDKEKHIDVHVFNTVTLVWRTLTPGGRERHPEAPSWRYGHTTVVIEETVYLWGGCRSRRSYRGKRCNVLHAFDVDFHTWSQPDVSGALPVGRHHHSACVLRKVIFIHGGRPRADTKDTHKLDTSTMVWTLIHTRGTGLFPRTAYHSATIIGTKMFVFGGTECCVYRQPTRVLDTETNLWLDTPSAQLGPEVRWSHSAFTYGGEMYIFGGWNGKYLNDVWKFTPETFSWKKVEPKGKGLPLVRNMCCCMVGDRVILYGGDNTPDDLYILDLSPSLKTLCKLAVIQYSLDQSGLPHNIRWELAAMKYK